MLQSLSHLQNYTTLKLEFRGRIQQLCLRHLPELHYSQTQELLSLIDERFETFTELHYSQTALIDTNFTSMFETFTELHYSQTMVAKVYLLVLFETFTELHYSQTSKTIAEWVK